MKSALAQVLHLSGSMTKYLLIVLSMLAALGCSSSDNGSGSTGVSVQPPPLDRLIEEGDIVWLDGSTLYVLNQSKGLSVIGIGDPSAPTLMSRASLSGTPVEMYLHNGYILALNSGISSASSSTTSSRMTVIDVRKPGSPLLAGYVGLSGTTTNSRLVGDVLYTASDSGAVIESVNVANPGSPQLVDRITLPLGTSGSNVLATENVFYVATESYQGTAMGECASSYYDNEGCTTIFAIDISSPVGVLRFGANYAMAGMLKDRWGMDAYGGVFRVLVARDGWWTSTGSLTATLRTFNSPDASHLDPIATLSLDTAHLEKVMAVRFDGPRAYLVTYRQADPLFTIDLSDPANPTIAGYLQTPGWLDFIIPRGNRLLGIGRDWNSQSAGWHLQASIYDVSNLGSPRLMDRIPFGDSYSALPDQADNLAKVVRTVDDLSLLLVPYNSTSTGYSQDNTGGRVEIVSYANDTLGTFGQIAAASEIVRAVPLPPNHIAVVTEPAVGVVQLTPSLEVSGVVDLNQSLAGTPTKPDAGSPVDGGSQPGDAGSPVDGGFHD